MGRTPKVQTQTAAPTAARDATIGAPCKRSSSPEGRARRDGCGASDKGGRYPATAPQTPEILALIVLPRARHSRHRRLDRRRQPPPPHLRWRADSVQMSGRASVADGGDSRLAACGNGRRLMGPGGERRQSGLPPSTTGTRRGRDSASATCRRDCRASAPSHLLDGGSSTLPQGRSLATRLRGEADATSMAILRRGFRFPANRGPRVMEGRAIPAGGRFSAGSRAEFSGRARSPVARSIRRSRFHERRRGLDDGSGAGPLPDARAGG